jgi:hypothetical protein
MRTYSTHRLMTGSDYPLNGGLGGYYRGKLPRVPWAIGYNPKLQDMIGSLQWHTAGEPHTPY